MAEKEKLDICMALHDPQGTYSKYVGITMLSVLDHTKHPVCFHVLMDRTVSTANQEILLRIARENGGEVQFYCMDLSDLHYDIAQAARFTIGTLFRLKMMEVLPGSVKRVLYLDADLLVMTDVAEIFSMDDGKHLLAGVLHTADEQAMFAKKGILHPEQYVNAGVLLWNLKQIRARHINLYQESNVFFEKHPHAGYADQDAINAIFKDEILFLPEFLNRQTVLSRQLEEREPHGIYHFRADVPRENGTYMIDRLFLSYLKRTPWWTEAFVKAFEARKEARKEAETFVESLISSKRPIAFFGAAGVLHRLIMKQFTLSSQDFFVDNNQLLWETKHMGRPVKNPEILKTYPSGEIGIIVTIYRYPEIRTQLTSMGFQENVDFCMGKYLLPENVLPLIDGERENPWDVVVEA